MTSRESSVDETAYLVVLEGVLRDPKHVAEKLPPPDRYARVVIDCANVRSIDTAVIAELMSYRARWVMLGRDPLELVLVLNEQVHHLFDLTGASRTMTVLRSRKTT